MPTDDWRQRPAAVDDRRAAVLARYALVEEGDYFEISASRDATADDVAAGVRSHRARAGVRGRSVGRWPASWARSSKSCARCWARRCGARRQAPAAALPESPAVRARPGGRGKAGDPGACGVLRLARLRGAVAAAVAAGTTLVAVVSQPDRPAGRGQAPTPPAVKVAATALGVPVIQPETLRTPEAEATLRGVRRRPVRRRRLRPHPAAAAAGSAAARALERARVAVAAGCAAPRRSSGRSSAVTARRVSPSCAWRPASTPGRSRRCARCAIADDDTAGSLSDGSPRWARSCSARRCPRLPTAASR